MTKEELERLQGNIDDAVTSLERQIQDVISLMSHLNERLSMVEAQSKANKDRIPMPKNKEIIEMICKHQS